MAIGARYPAPVSAPAEDLVLPVAGHAGEGRVAVEDARPGRVDRAGAGDRDRVVGRHDPGPERAEPLRVPSRSAAGAGPGRSAPRPCRPSSGSCACNPLEQPPRHGDPLPADRDQLPDVRPVLDDAVPIGTERRLHGPTCREVHLENRIVPSRQDLHPDHADALRALVDARNRPLTMSRCYETVPGMSINPNHSPQGGTMAIPTERAG